MGDDEILINSGHNPDFYSKLGLGWWEDSPNYVKYAINTNQKFMTFTSLEPIFCHYAKNHDSSQPGKKTIRFCMKHTTIYLIELNTLVGKKVAQNL